MDDVITIQQDAKGRWVVSGRWRGGVRIYGRYRTLTLAERRKSQVEVSQGLRRETKTASQS